MWFGSNAIDLAISAEYEVAYVSHVAGFLTGFLLAAILDWFVVFPHTSHEQTLLQRLGIGRDAG